MTILPNQPHALCRESTTLVGLLDWAYRRQCADAMIGRGLHGLEAGADGDDGGAFSRGGSNAATIAMNGQLGCIIRSTGWQQAPDVHPDAIAVVNAVEMLDDGPGRWLVVEHARRGTSPTWGSEPYFVPSGVYRHDLGVVIRHDEVQRPHKRPQTVEVRACPVELHPSPAYVAMCRDEYRRWYLALEVLALVLDHRSLTRWRVDGIGADPEPWK